MMLEKLRGLARDLINGLSVGSIEEPFIKSNVGSLSFCLLLTVFSIGFISIVDRQPSPPYIGQQIGSHPGFTFQKTTELLPYEFTLFQTILVMIFPIVLFVATQFCVSKISNPKLEDGVLAGVAGSILYAVALASFIWVFFDYYETRSDAVHISLGYIIAELNHLYLLILALLGQSLLLGVLLVLYFQPLIPPAYLNTKTDSAEGLRRHIKRSWRFTQLSISGIIAIVVSVSLPILVGKTRTGLLNTLLVVAVLLSFAFSSLLFPALKIYYAGKIRSEASN